MSALKLKIPLLVSLLCLAAIPMLSQAKSIQASVYAVTDGISLQVMTQDRHKLSLKLPAVKLAANDTIRQQNAKKRLTTLAMGKTVTLELLPAAMISIKVGDMNLSARMLAEKLVDPDMPKIQQLPAQVRTELLNATNQPSQNLSQSQTIRQINQQSSPTVNYPNRYYQPYWYQGLPAPMTRAPVYQPAK